MSKHLVITLRSSNVQSSYALLVKDQRFLAMETVSSDPKTAHQRATAQQSVFVDLIPQLEVLSRINPAWHIQEDIIIQLRI